ncbi:putative mrna capping enzyme alpha protein [Phaeoacremonium minimum UCRPA7]|uniref:mRNA-capping enzyme subunit alpha n=1 Tax=Phaeoacremonium minimum (strain UCR-PA7) TaxID=1286976 RepID=R8BYH9_PHAM7|nr:putative mrna capping enzyme alpha protein [Phaeoacremonium minimum UCRPA7]EOO04446.1 putative mrna capping enzyme alpha protein [Phaeoacremonium minimum UCRPA7]
MDSASGPITAIDQPGLKAEGQLLYHLRREVADLLQRNQISFPGAQPVSFAQKHIDELLSRDYYVCEKTDGIRYLLYLTSDETGSEIHYLIDRKNDFWFIHHKNLHFPLQGDDQAFHTRTIVDGELVIDEEPDGTKKPKFLVFDCLVIDGKVLLERSLDKRLAYFQANVFKPYEDLFKRFPQERPFQAFQLQMKDMQLGYGIEKMFGEVLPHLKHGNDGLIFTCVGTPYQFGTDQHILKWKPAEENTVDFKLRLEFPMVEPDDIDRAEGVTKPYIDYEAVPHVQLLTNYGGEASEPYQPYAELYLTEEEWDKLKSLGDPLQGRVVECAMDEHQRWRLYRFRDDKLDANHIKVVKSVIDSILHPVGKEDLLEVAPQIKDNWKIRADRLKAQQSQKR